MTLLDASKKYYIVDYDYTTGEYGIPKQKLMEGEQDEAIDTILDSYFSDFFGEGTYKDDNCYWAYDGCQVIKITSWKEVPVADAVILKKYLY